MKDVISIRLEKELSERLDDLAKATGRSASWHAREAIERYLAEEQETDTCNFDLERMKKSIEGPFFTLPARLTREEMRDHLLQRAAACKSVMNIGKDDSMAISKRGRDAIVAAHQEDAE